MSTISKREEFKYDVFISYSSADEAWVKNELLQTLQNNRLKVCIYDRDFSIGESSVKNMAQAIMNSRKTLLVLTSNYLNSEWTEFEASMALSLDPANRKRRLIPLLKEKCDLPLYLGKATYVDFTDPENMEMQWNRLIEAVGPPISIDEYDLQQDVIKLLKDVSSLMQQASHLMDHDDVTQRDLSFSKRQGYIDDVILKVEKLELRMAIVAPMKAGKSTIINAIIGQALLPTRNEAMTTIPTEIVHAPERPEPVLSVSQNAQRVFENAIQALQKEIKRKTLKKSLDDVRQYPRLPELVQEIVNKVLPTKKKRQTKLHGEEPAISSIFHSNSEHGREAVYYYLTKLNDIARLCSILLAPQDTPLPKLTTEDVPRILTPFRQSEKTDVRKELGTLVIVDTPGPNEATKQLDLEGVVKKQLEQSSIVLIVLDFTKLKNDEAERIKQLVQPFIGVIGTKNLLVLVNRIDQRKGDGLNTEQVREFVAGHLGLPASDIKDRIYELSALRAFRAVDFLRDLERNFSTANNSMETAHALAQEVFSPLSWKKDLERATMADLQSRAKELLEISRFAPFFNKAIALLIRNTVPNIIISALTTSIQHLDKLREAMTLRFEAIKRDKKNLNKEIKKLTEDIAELQQSQLEQEHQAGKIKKMLGNKLKGSWDQRKFKTRISLKIYSGGEEFTKQHQSFIEQLEMHQLRNRFEEQINAHKKLSRKKQSSIKEISFKTEQEANLFLDVAVNHAQKCVSDLLKDIQNDVRRQIEETHLKLTELLESGTRPIAEKVRDQLRKGFKMKVAMVDIQLPPPDIDLAGFEPIRHDWKFAEYYKQKETFITFLFWTITRQVKVKVDTRTGTTYKVQINDIIEKVSNELKKNVGQIGKALSDYIEKDLNRGIEGYFGAFFNYLNNYKNSLSCALQDQELALDQKQQLKKELNSFSKSAAAYKKQAEIYSKRAEKLKEYQI